MQQLGLLQIRTVGGDRFRLLASESQPNGLMIGEIDLIEADEDQRVPDEHRPCVDLLTRIIEDMSAQLAEKRRTGEAAEGSPVLAQLPFEEPFQMDSSAWVSNRLCEVLPVPLKAKAKADGADRRRHASRNRSHVSEAALGAEVAGLNYTSTGFISAATAGASAPATALSSTHRLKPVAAVRSRHLTAPVTRASRRPHQVACSA